MLNDIIDSEKASAILATGVQWQAGGWNTSRALKTLYELTGLPLVTADFTQYRNSYLYALAMFWSVEVDELNLTDRAAEAAFGLVDALNGETGKKDRHQRTDRRTRSLPW